MDPIYLLHRDTLANQQPTVNRHFSEATIHAGRKGRIPSSLLTLPMILVVIKTLRVRPLFFEIQIHWTLLPGSWELPNCIAMATIRLTSSPTCELQQQEVSRTFMKSARSYKFRNGLEILILKPAAKIIAWYTRPMPKVSTAISKRLEKTH